MTEGEGVYVSGVGGEEPVVLNTGPLGDVCIGMGNG